MHPSRAATLLALLGAALLLAALTLRGFSLVQAVSENGLPASRLPGSLAVVGGYTPIEDGALIAFQQSRPGGPPLETAWYQMPVSGGKIMPSEPPESSLEPFLVRGGYAYVLVADGSGVLGGLPRGEMLVNAALAPDKNKLAFATRTSSGRARLYLLYVSGQLDWLGEEAGYIDLDWSPTSERLAFVSPQDGIDQVFTVRLNGDEYRQLTADPARKSSPRWSPDGRSIAYLAVSGRGGRTAGLGTPTTAPLLVFPTLTPPPGQFAPQPGRTDIFLMAEDGSRQRALTDTPEQEFALAWLVTSRGSELGYAARLPERPALAYYYSVSLGGSSSGPRRIYPPVLLEGIQCPLHFPNDRPSTVRITLNNSGLVPLDLPLILRARARPFILAGAEGQNAAADGAAQAEADAARTEADAARAETDAVRTETVTLLPGETRVLEWQVNPAPGRFTYLSVITDLEDPYPLYEQHCAAPNSYLGLPNLPYLALTIPLALLGLALCLPRLFQHRSLGWWLLWLLSGISLLGLLLLEISL